MTTHSQGGSVGLDDHVAAENDSGARIRREQPFQIETGGDGAAVGPSSSLFDDAATSSTERDRLFQHQAGDHVGDPDDNVPLPTSPSPLPQPRAADATFRNFAIMSCLFGALHGSGLACLALATARYGRIGAWQSGLLYLSFTLSAVSGLAVYATKRLGSRDTMLLGMIMFDIYVACFWVAGSSPAGRQEIKMLVGAVIGGVGGGCLWTAQGVYFGQASEQYAVNSGNATAETSNAWFAGVFAFTLLAEETVLDVMSTLLIRVFHVPWAPIFAVYAGIAVVSTVAMTSIHKYQNTGVFAIRSPGGMGDWTSSLSSIVWHKFATVFRLLIDDPKMKYMIGFNAAFGFSGAFLNSFVSGEVVPVALQDAQSSWVGLLVAVHGTVAAAASLLFGRISAVTGRKGPILVVGLVCFASVAIPFLIQPDLQAWNWKLLLFVYSAEGIGRATFEGTLKAVFADYFSYEKEGAFANIILQDGLASSVAYYLSFQMKCSATSMYCIQYRDGSYHDLLGFGTIVIVVSIVGMLGFWRASYLYEHGCGNMALESYRAGRQLCMDDSSISGAAPECLDNRADNPPLADGQRDNEETELAIGTRGPSIAMVRRSCEPFEITTSRDNEDGDYDDCYDDDDGDFVIV